MGHIIGYLTYNENVSKTSVTEDIIERARRDGDSGYTATIIWHDNIPPFDTEEQAREFIKAHDNGWYDDHAVRFKDYSKAVKTAKIAEYEAKVIELWEGKKKYEKEHSVHNFQAKYIGCEICGSKLSKSHLTGERCPLCRADLRSKTTLEKIKWYEDKIADYRKRIEAEKMKQKKNAKIMWLVKYEFHT